MEDHSEKIQDYIEGQLTGDDLLRFEAQLIVDGELRNLLALQTEVYEVLEKRIVSPEMELRATLISSANNFRYSSEPRKVFKFKRLISILVAASILLIGSLFFFNTNNDLFELPVMHSEIVRGQEVNVTYEDAVEAFNSHQYSIARSQLEALLAISPNQAQYQYYLGLTYVGEEKWEKAIHELNPLIAGESVFSEEAKYYLAICYYRSGDAEKAITLLKQITADGELSIRAKKLLAKIS